MQSYFLICIPVRPSGLVSVIPSMGFSPFLEIAKYISPLYDNNQKIDILIIQTTMKISLMLFKLLINKCYSKNGIFNDNFLYQNNLFFLYSNKYCIGPYDILFIDTQTAEYQITHGIP
jgi:hypothetical protein